MAIYYASMSCKMKTDIIKAEYETLIFTIRGRKVMIDSDLALLYEVPNKALKQQVNVT